MQGKAKRLCGAKKKHAPGTCELAAGWGTDHTGTGYCKKHGGSTPSHQKAAEKELAAAAVVVYGLPIEIDPHAALLEELHRTAGHVAWLQQLIGDFEKNAELKQISVSEDGGITERPSVWIQLYADERKHFAAVAKTCISVGIEERRVLIAEQTGQLMAQVIRAVLEENGIDPNSEDARKSVRKHLSLVA